MANLEHSGTNIEGGATASANASAPLDALRVEAFGCQRESNATPARLSDPLAQATRETQTSALGLPADATPREVCVARGLWSIREAKGFYSSFNQALDKADPKALNEAVMEISIINEPAVAEATRESVDNLLDQRGLGHSWTKDGKLSIFKNFGSVATVDTFGDREPSATRVEKDGQGQITNAFAESPFASLRELTAK